MTPRDRRAIWMGGAVVVPALVAVWLIRPYVANLGKVRAETAVERDLLAREQALLRDVPATRSRLGTLDTALDRMSVRLFPGPDELAATAALASYVGEAARRQGLLFQQGETRPPSPASGGLVAIEVGVRATGDLEGILGLLAALELRPPLVQVTRLSIERTNGGRQEPDRETLAVSMVARAYAAGKETPAHGSRPIAAPATTNLALAAIGPVVDADPFRMDRRRPPRRFALPGTVRAVRPAVATPTLSLAGTVVYPDGGGVALIRMPGRTGTQLVRVGESIQGLTLRAVAREEATFARPGGGTLVLRVPKAGG